MPRLHEPKSSRSPSRAWSPRWGTVFGVLAVLGTARGARAATLDWKGHTWQVTASGMAGVCDGDPANVSVDVDGYLHLRIANNGGTWSAAEVFTTDRVGFGTYQWQIDGPIDVLDPNVVLGLFPYGPAAGIGGDGTNEIDIEYSRWGRANGANGDWTNYPASGSTIGEHSYSFSLGGETLSTSRFTWTGTSITDFLFAGLVPSDTTAKAIETWTYEPPNPMVNIPQEALPLGMNLWCFEAPPSNDTPVEIVIRDFAFVPLGSSSGAGGAGGAGGTAGSGGTGGTAGSGAAGAPSAGDGGDTAEQGGAAGAAMGGGGAGAGTAGSGQAGAAMGGGGAGAGMAGSGQAGVAMGGSSTAGSTGAGGGAAGALSSAGGGVGGVGAPSPGSGGAQREDAGCACNLTRRRHSSNQRGSFLLIAALAVVGRRVRRRSTASFRPAALRI